MATFLMPFVHSHSQFTNEFAEFCGSVQPLVLPLFFRVISSHLSCHTPLMMENIT